MVPNEAGDRLASGCERYHFHSCTGIPHLSDSRAVEVGFAFLRLFYI